MDCTKEEWDRLKSNEQYGMYTTLEGKITTLIQKINVIENKVMRDQKDQWKIISDLMNELCEEGQVRSTKMKKLLGKRKE